MWSVGFVSLGYYVRTHGGYLHMVCMGLGCASLKSRCQGWLARDGINVAGGVSF
jgi:hypothetical protein